MKVSLAKYGKPSSTATLQASPLFGETDGVWAVTTYLEKGPKELARDVTWSYPAALKASTCEA